MPYIKTFVCRNCKKMVTKSFVLNSIPSCCSKECAKEFARKKFNKGKDLYNLKKKSKLEDPRYSWGDVDKKGNVIIYKNNKQLRGNY